MAVAAAIGVGEGEEADVMSQRLASATSRLSGKRSLLRSSSAAGMSQQATAGQTRPVVAGSSGLSEINRSIEKMTLQPMNNGGLLGEPKQAGMGGSCKTSRRDSDWTSVSTEDPGYGSLRSDLNTSRRGSELSTVSQVYFIILWLMQEKSFDGWEPMF